MASHRRHRHRASHRRTWVAAVSATAACAAVALASSDTDAGPGTGPVSVDALPLALPSPAATGAAPAPVATVAPSPSPPATATPTIPAASRSSARPTLRPTAKPAAFPVLAAAKLDWTALAQCESGGDPSSTNGGAGNYYGLYQFSVSTWRSMGGTGLPSKATAAEQTYRAELLYDQQGSSPWPTCGHHLLDK